MPAHVLPLSRLPARPAPEMVAVAADVRPQATQPLQAALRSLGEVQMHDLVAGFLDRLDHALQQLADEARMPGEVQAAADLSDALALSRAALLRGVTQSYLRRFSPTTTVPLLDLDRLSLPPAEEMEENIALAHLAQQVERRAGEPGRQLQARLGWAARDLALPVLASAFAPQALGACFAESLRAQDIPTTLRVLAYRLVEREALNDWRPLVDEALALLDRHGLRFPRVVATPPVAAANDTAGDATRQCLHQRATTTGPDALFAAECVAQLASQGPATCALTLAGDWFDALLAEPQTPADFMAHAETLRFSVLKAAVADRGFFTHPSHPVRRSVGELLEKAALARPQGQTLERAAAEAAELVDRMGISAAFAQDFIARCQPLDADERAAFLECQQQECKDRRETLLLKIRCLVMRQLEAHTLGCNLPPAARAVLNGGFLPLLSAALLSAGAGSPQDRQVRALLDDFTGSFDGSPGLLDADGEALAERLCMALLELGLREDRVARLMERVEPLWQQRASTAAQREADLELALQALEPAVAAPAAAGFAIASSAFAANDMPTPVPGLNSAAAVDEALRVLLKPERWFRVRDRKTGDDRWLCLSAWYPQQDSLSFRGFDEAASLGLRASRFIEDLIAGHSEPLNPEPEVLQMLAAMRAARTQSAALISLHAVG